MLHEAADQVATPSPSALRTAYEERLQSSISAHGAETVAAETGIETDRIEALSSGASAEGDAVRSVTVAEAAAILAVDPETPDADAIVFELRDHLLMGMTTSVLDVDTIAANVEIDLTGQEIQQAIEGRAEMTLAQLAAIQSVIDGWTED